MCNTCVDIQEVKSLFSLFGYWGSNGLDGKHFYQLNHLFNPHLTPPFLNFILFYVYGYFPWICILCLPDANRSQKKVLDHLELELEVVVRHHASGNWTFTGEFLLLTAESSHLGSQRKWPFKIRMMEDLEIIQYRETKSSPVPKNNNHCLHVVWFIQVLFWFF